MLAGLDGTRFLADLLRIMGVDLLLSQGNAVVIALASRSLPEAQRSWPSWAGARPRWPCASRSAWRSRRC
jgi:predicted tellurium resistance membrane protein TerC